MVRRRPDNVMSVESKAARIAALLGWFVAFTALAWIAVRGRVAPYGPWVSLGTKGLISLGSGALLGAWVYRQGPAATFALGAPARGGLARGIGVIVLYLAAVTALGYALGQPPAAEVPGAMAVVTQLVNSTIEEAAFRGLLVLHLAREMRFWMANALGGLAFVAVHVPTFAAIADPASVVVMSLSLFALALALGEATRATRSIWVAVVGHTVNNLLV